MFFRLVKLCWLVNISRLFSHTRISHFDKNIRSCAPTINNNRLTHVSLLLVIMFYFCNNTNGKDNFKFNLLKQIPIFIVMVWYSGCLQNVTQGRGSVNQSVGFVHVSQVWVLLSLVLYEYALLVLRTKKKGKHNQ